MEWSVLLEVAPPAGTSCLKVDDPTFNVLLDRLGEKGATNAIGHDGRRISLRLTIEGGDDVCAVLDQLVQLLGAARREACSAGWPVLRDDESGNADEVAGEIGEVLFPEVMGASEAATMLRVSRQRLDELRKFRSFPRPVATLATGPLWLRAALEAFAASWEREKGRPHIREEVRRLVDEEMKFIPHGGHEQNMFRSAYRNARFHGLGSHATIDATPEAARDVALRVVRRKFPSFEPRILPATAT